MKTAIVRIAFAAALAGVVALGLWLSGCTKPQAKPRALVATPQCCSSQSGICNWWSTIPCPTPPTTYACCEAGAYGCVFVSTRCP